MQKMSNLCWIPATLKLYTRTDLPRTSCYHSLFRSRRRRRRRRTYRMEMMTTRRMLRINSP
jgi:hypothetical protein